MSNLATQEDLKRLRTLVQKLGWGEFMGHVAGLMAEQSDKVDGERSSALFAGSNTITSLREFWEACGRFEYPPGMVDVGEGEGGSDD
jgi:hypothetical protein